MVKQPIFILAPLRSFTSLVCAMLGQHPELYGVPELNLFQAENMEEFWTGRSADGQARSPFLNIMRHGLLRTVGQLYMGEQTILSIEAAETWIRVRHNRSTADVYRELCEKIAPLRMIDKSPGYVRKDLFLQRLQEAFPDARYIHLIRHPRGQCESTMSVHGGQLLLFLIGSIDRSGPTPILDPQILWHDSNVRIMRMLDRVPGQWIRVRGEDLIEKPRDSLREICGWLGISAEDEAIESMMHPEDSPYSTPGPVNAHLGNDPNFLASPSLRPARPPSYDLEEPLPWRPDGASFTPQVVELAREFGYA
jgi:hypothetical protein